MTRPARIPADVNRPDRVLGPFTARQSVLLFVTAGALYAAWLGLRDWVPLPIFLAAAVPVAALAVAVALGQRDGLSLDRFLLAALRHHANPRRPRPTHNDEAHAALDDGNRGRRAHAALRPGPAGLLTHAHTTSLEHDPAGPGVLDLGAEGLVAIAVVSTLNLGLHTPAEQDALLSGFARYLHTLTGPVQFLIRTVPVDLDQHLSALYDQARTLPHPALVTAALGHRAHLTHLAAPATHRSEWGDDRDGLTARQVLLVLREPAAGTGGQRLARRLEDAVRILATLDIAVTPLDAAQISALLSDCTNPDHPAAGHPRTSRPHGAGAAPVTPIAIVRQHPQPELDDHELEELSFAHDRPPRPAPRPHGTADPWDRLPRVPTPLAPVDFALADDRDVLDDRDISDDPQAEDGGWFDDRGLPDHAGYDDRARNGGVGDELDAELEIEEFGPAAGAARWWGR